MKTILDPIIPRLGPAKVLAAALNSAVCCALILSLGAGCGRSGTSASHSKKRSPIITAMPNPVPPGPGQGTTTVAWDTGDGEPGEVYVAVTNSEEKLFWRSAKGSRDAPWISPGVVYEFRLFRGTNHTDLLASVQVTKNRN